MAISWITALKLVPWDEVIKATPQLLKTTKSLLKKKAPIDGAMDAASPVSTTSSSGIPLSTGEQALQLIQAQESRIAFLQQAQHQSIEVIEQLVEQNAQIVKTVDALRTGSQRLLRAVVVLSVVVLGLLIYMWRT
jgi:hypothetical protein